MKLIRILFQAIVLLATLVVFSHPVQANAGDTLQTEKLVVPSTPLTKSNPAHLSTSMILAEFKTGFIGGIVPGMALLLFGRVVWLVSSRPRTEMEMTQAPPVVVPPLRTTPGRVTKF